MLTSAEIRRQFIDFFVQKHGHVFAPSSPVVPHDDPTLLFTNAGMNQFKPIFLGQVDPASDLAKLKRAANSQKCIRAGGKHNDLDDVGKDFYHHTFFEMLGNWSFGDYFKKEAIDWAWELFTQVWGIDAGRLYATYFGGDAAQGLDPDDEARELWLRYLPEDHVLPGNMKDNFWEMGDTGPCGPCSEIHIDSRPDSERAKIPGRELVNQDHGDVIELWNLVFIQFNRTADALRPLPAKHVDTGMGLERIARVLQGKNSNYDTDLFTPLFAKIQEITGAPPYGGDLHDAKDIAYRVIADHIRTLVFAITDGATPGPKERGSVLRSVLRRAVRHGRSTLGAEIGFLSKLVPTVINQMGGFFPELTRNPEYVMDIVRQEEQAFGKTIEEGLLVFSSYIGQACARLVVRHFESLHPEKQFKDRGFGSGFSNIPGYRVEIVSSNSPDEPFANNVEVDVELVGDSVYLWKDSSRSEKLGTIQITARQAFILHDTYGFPIDLTQIMAEERGLTVDVEGFHRLMEEARERSRAGGGAGGADSVSTLPTDAVASLQKLGVQPTNDAAKYDPELRPTLGTVRAVWNGTDFDENVEAAHTKPTDRFAVVLDKTNFYAESGGQVGDAGRLIVTREARSSARDKNEGGEMIVEDTRVTAGYVLHIGRVKKGEIRVGDTVEARLDKPRRQQTMANHTGTHLLNFALRETLGDHIDQKGSLVAPDRLRFDFSHNASIKAAEVEKIERIVREQIASDLAVHASETPLKDAKSINGVRAVFGETYPDPVRVVSIGPSAAEMLAAPDDAQWRGYSVEFCGGTHLPSTGKAEAFTLTDEEAVAKGVRRVVCLTGAAAKEAIEAGMALRMRTESAGSLDAGALESEVQVILAALESQTLPSTDKSRVREAVAGLQEKLKSARKAAAAAGRGDAVEAARAMAAAATEDVIIGKLHAGADRGALLAAMDVVRAKRPEAAVMLLSVDEEEGKVSIAANVPDAFIKRGLKAGDWVRVAAQACGGKGGGRPDSAQGGGTDVTKVADAIAAARDHATAIA